MKTSGHLIFYISENEDFELWRVLSQISPDDRAAFVKSALRKALLGNEGRTPSHNWAKNNVLRMDKNFVDSPMSELALEELGYHSVSAVSEEKIRALKNFPEGRSSKDYQMTVKNELPEEDNLLQLDELLQSSENMNHNSLPGLNFLLNNVIGEEDDEKVIEFIRNNQTASGENS